jgi:hypothetical protein
MATNLAISPYSTTNSPGAFNISSKGYIAGQALPDPALRNELAGGILANTETLPMFGGVGISELILTSTSNSLPRGELGSTIVRATTLTPLAAGVLTGFSVFDQNHAMVASPSSPVPGIGGNGQVNFYRLGSGIRIAVACAPALVNLQGQLITSQVSWDFGAQQLVPYNVAYPANVITASSWAAGTNNKGQVTYTTTTAHTVAVGEYFTISGMVPVGYNGTFLAVTGTAGSTLVGVAAYGGTIANPGASTTQGTLVAGGGALNVRVLDVDVGNSMAVNYDPVSGFATWNRSATCAVILL